MALHRHNIISKDVLAMVLAGGQGERLFPLTRHRSKPSVPFGGLYRIIDFTLSNCLNSGMRRIYVLTQYKSSSLERHIKMGWDPIFSAELGEWILTVPPQLRVGQRWYEGTADAVFQNIYLIERDQPRRVLVLSGDHIYKMDYLKLIEAHEQAGAAATIGAVEVPRSEAGAFGVLKVDASNRILEFAEKVPDPPTIPGRPDTCLANMGVYCFETDVLTAVLRSDSSEKTRHDFGHDILPGIAAEGRLFAYPFLDENRKEQRYWRDVGTLDAYFEASMDLVDVHPVFNLYDREWPIRTAPRQVPPAKTVFAQDKPGGRRGVALDSLVCGGVIISGGYVERSILSPHVRVNSFARVTESVLMDGVDVGRYARLHKTLVDKNVQIPPGAVIGENLEQDRERFTVSDHGVVVVTQDSRIEPGPVPDAPSELAG